MHNHTLSPDTQVNLLLCGRLGQKTTAEPHPLTPAEYRTLARWLFDHSLCPGDLLRAEVLQRFSTEQHAAPFPAPERIAQLLGRGAALALAVEGWTNKGLWVVSQSDSAYPQRLRERLKQAAPPILYGAGEPILLNNTGFVIVGSRDVDTTGIQQTRKLSEHCARQAIAVVSGGARGVDTEALLAALDAGGNAVGVLADSLAKAAVDRKYRDALREGRLVIVSPYDPYASFNVGHAMERNKYIYALGEWACIISSGHQKGGTWTGAIEQLERYQWLPLYVHSGTDAPEGNTILIERGGIACSIDTLTDDIDIRSWLDMHTAQSNAAQKPGSQPDLAPPAAHDLFGIIWPYLEQELQTPQTPEQLRDVFTHILIEQLRSWLKHAEKLGKVQRVSDKAYVVYAKNTETEEAKKPDHVPTEEQLLLL
jgi:predicted Rossmann fold nucleotide-binding protein DprA/Smf involved in DNA uptake